MEHSVLVDSDFWIALYSKSDTNHNRAENIIASLANDSVLHVFLSSFVYAETVTILSQRVSRETARYFMDDIGEQGATLLYINEDVFSIAQHLFKKQRSKNTSFVDVVNISLLQSYSFSGILSFDRDYKRNGIHVMT
ncbi:MAG: PIN domain-containing protein [Patescibacteria group bacterium]